MAIAQFREFRTDSSADQTVFFNAATLPAVEWRLRIEEQYASTIGANPSESRVAERKSQIEGILIFISSNNLPSSNNWPS